MTSKLLVSSPSHSEAPTSTQSCPPHYEPPQTLAFSALKTRHNADASQLMWRCKLYLRTQACAMDHCSAQSLERLQPRAGAAAANLGWCVLHSAQQGAHSQIADTDQCQDRHPSPLQSQAVSIRRLDDSKEVVCGVRFKIIFWVL